MYTEGARVAITSAPGDGQGDLPRAFLTPGPLWKAYEETAPCVLLIDEIDKAPRDFPNDLLHELDAMTFSINETSETIEAKHRPVVIITSNSEKELPDAFLRRCVFHFIDFPDVDQMRKIVDVHHPQVEKKLLEQVLVKFYWLREQKELRKRPSTSELIDWITALLRAGVNPAQLEAELPFMGALLKNEQDTKVISQYLDRDGKLPTSMEELKGTGRR